MSLCGAKICKHAILESMTVGVVVPTLGRRQDYLLQSLRSIRESGSSYIILIAPRGFNSIYLMNQGLVDEVQEDPQSGLPSAIELGIRSLPEHIEIITWLGDDDLLEPNALNLFEEELKNNESLSMIFGRCKFINEDGTVFDESRLGRLAVPLLLFGPDFIPQPASAFRRRSFVAVGGFDPNLKLAFDLDLFIKLSRIGKVKFVDFLAASYRWHSKSLSASNKAASRSEGRKVRASHLPPVLRFLSFFWEYPQELLARLTNRLDRMSS